LESLQRDLRPERELQVWELITATYLDFCGSQKMPNAARREVFKFLLGYSAGMPVEILLDSAKWLKDNDLQRLAELFTQAAGETSEG
jgi:hypothetical protein